MVKGESARRAVSPFRSARGGSILGRKPEQPGERLTWRWWNFGE